MIDNVDIIVYARNEDYHEHHDSTYEFENGDLRVYNPDGSYSVYNRNYWSRVEFTPTHDKSPHALAEAYPEVNYVKEYPEVDEMKYKPKMVKKV